MKNAVSSAFKGFRALARGLHKRPAMFKKSLFTMAVFWSLLGAASGFASTDAGNPFQATSPVQTTVVKPNQGENLNLSGSKATPPGEILAQHFDAQQFNNYPMKAFQMPKVTEESPFTAAVYDQLRQQSQQPIFINGSQNVVNVGNSGAGVSGLQTQMPQQMQFYVPQFFPLTAVQDQKEDKAVEVKLKKDEKKEVARDDKSAGQGKYVAKKDDKKDSKKNDKNDSVAGKGTFVKEEKVVKSDVKTEVKQVVQAGSAK